VGGLPLWWAVVCPFGWRSGRGLTEDVVGIVRVPKRLKNDSEVGRMVACFMSTCLL
jgi:hypothetical protein